jgi:hypothetical protein
MEIFLPATALGFVVYEILAYLRPPRKNAYRLLIGEIGIKFGRTSAILAQYVLLALMAMAILAILLLLHVVLLPNALAHNRINILLGFVCGPTLGIWLNSIIRLPPNKSLRKSQIVGGIGLVILIILGSIGDEGVNLIQQYSKHISSLRVGGTELQFVQKGRGDATPGAPSSPVAGQGTAVKSFAPSQGLQYASHLGRWFIARDLQYFDLFKLSDPALPSVRRFTTEVIERPLNCLSGWSQTAAEDSISVEQHVRSFAGIFRYLHDLKNDAFRKKFVDEFLHQSKRLAADVELFAKLSTSNDGPCQQLTQASMSNWDVEKNIDEIKANDEFEQRPYLAIAHASLMAQLGQYPAAGAILETWLDEQNAQRAAANKTQGKQALSDSVTAADWYELRARSVLAAYLEEWVERDEASVTTPLRDEHLKNLDALRQGLKMALENTTFFAALLETNYRGRSINLKNPSNCRFHDEGGKTDLWRYLFTSYITIELYYDLNTMLHPDYNKDFAEQTTDSLRTLAQLDVSCAAQESDRKVLYAQILEAYSRNAISYSDAKRDSESDDARKARLYEAMRAAEKGLEMVQASVRADRAARPKAFTERIAQSDAIATEEALTSDPRRLKSLREE